MRSLGYKNSEIKFKEPFKGLFTQGMVCHETYRDKDNNWLSPDEIEFVMTIFQKKMTQVTKLKLASESMSKSKKCN